jgi:hypothetical protein
MKKGQGKVEIPESVSKCWWWRRLVFLDFDEVTHTTKHKIFVPEYPLLFATISGAHVYGFLFLAVLWTMMWAVAGCTTQPPMQETVNSVMGTNVTPSEATVTDSHFGVTKPFSFQPVVAVMEIIPAKVRKGGTGEILVRLEIAAAHRIYSTNVVGKPFVPISLKVTLPGGIESSGGWVAPVPDRTKTGELVYTDSASFRRPFRVGSNVATGPLSIKCELLYQACTDELCWPPRTITLSSPVNISSPTK